MTTKELTDPYKDLVSDFVDEENNGTVHLQYLAVEEEPLVTNTYVAATPDCILIYIELCGK